jgi:hypothetical protein
VYEGGMTSSHILRDDRLKCCSTVLLSFGILSAAAPAAATAATSDDKINLHQIVALCNLCHFIDSLLTWSPVDAIESCQPAAK